jgi:very-short-patch-repair endonuclease
MFLYNHPKQKSFRQRLRASNSRAEVFMWERLQRRQLLGLKFRRQYGVGKYVADFYCPAIRLVIEVDDSTHYLPGRPEYDKSRDEFMTRLNIKTIRVSSNEVLSNPDRVIEWLEEVCRTTPVLSARLPKPPLLSVGGVASRYAR